jgi:hypothetical protein
MTIWQIAAGDGARDYSDLFLKYDVMLIGPGDPGDYKQNPDGYEKEHMKNQIHSFCNNPKAGDLVLLRYGKKVKAVGIIPDTPDDGYYWSDQFEEVLGWDMQHARRVLWDTSAVLILNQDPKGLFVNQRLQSTFTAVHEKRITSLANKLKTNIKKRQLHSLPNIVGGTFTQEELGMELFKAGLPNNAVEDVLNTIGRIKRLANWYSSSHSANRPSEHEIVAHMIVPLMIGMGWSEQLLAVEWGKVDLAFFNKTPTDIESCIMICEAKRPDQSLTSAFEQAKKYVVKNQLNNCRTIITTDGSMLLMYKKNGTDWNDEPDGYVNLRNIRHENVFPFNTSGVQTLIELIPWKAMSNN